MLKSFFFILFVAGADWKFGVVKSYTESDDFHFLEFPCELEEGESISQNDLLLISKEKVLMVEDCVLLDFAGPARCTCTGFCTPMCLISALLSFGLFEFFTNSN